MTSSRSLLDYVHLSVDFQSVRMWTEHGLLMVKTVPKLGCSFDDCIVASCVCRLNDRTWSQNITDESDLDKEDTDADKAEEKTLNLFQ